MTTDKYGPIDFEDQFFQAYQAGADRTAAHNQNAWDMWMSYCDWLESWIAEESD